MSKKDDREELLNNTVGAYVESTGHLPSQDELPEIVNVVDNYLEGGDEYNRR